MLASSPRWYIFIFYLFIYGINAILGFVPFAVQIKIGDVNALTGKAWDNKLCANPQDYIGKNISFYLFIYSFNSLSPTYSNSIYEIEFICGSQAIIVAEPEYRQHPNPRYSNGMPRLVDNC